MLLTIPALHSNPGADLTIFLDFDGHTTSGTQWNTTYNNGNAIVSPAYDIDSNPTTFNAAEAAFIRRVWERVAEDFLPFNVNVTTVDPGLQRLQKSGAGDTQWGVRAILTSDQSWLEDDVGFAVGGVAYPFSFSASNDTPCFVFNGSDSDSLYAEVTAADSLSHEVGHTLGLFHDATNSDPTYYDGHGSGLTSWAPIMGVSFYDTVNELTRNLSQWSKGEYPDANNTEDDLFIITGGNTVGDIVAPQNESASGLRYRADDHGNVASSATLLTGSGAVIVGTGIIEKNTDVDAFAVDAAAGVLTINVEPAMRGANLDVLIQVYNTAGTLLATSNPVGLLTTAVSTTVSTAGRYYVRVRGTGKTATTNDPGYSNYGSLGAYSVRITRIDPQDIIGYVSSGFRVGYSTGSSFNSVSVYWPPASWDAIKYGDFNGDGQTDILGLLDGAWRVGVASGGTFTSYVWSTWSNNNWQNVMTGDIDGDGRDDIVARLGGNWWAALSTGTTFGTASIWTSWSNITWDDSFLADLTGDGKADLLARTSGYGWWTSTSTGSGFGIATNFTTWSSAAWDTPRLGDMNGDGRADLVGRLGNQWWVKLSSGGTTSLWAQWGATTWTTGRIGDINGDGYDDVLARDSASGQWWYAISNGSSAFTNPRVFTTWDTGSTWVDATVGDFNGDGRDDLAGRKGVEWWVSTSNGESGIMSHWGDWPYASWQFVTAISVRPAATTTAANSLASGSGSSLASSESSLPGAAAFTADDEFVYVATTERENLQSGRSDHEVTTPAGRTANGRDLPSLIRGELLSNVLEELLAA